MALLKQSTTYTRSFLMVDSSDHITGKTGLTVTLTLSKAGGAFAAAGGTITEVSSGWYKVALTTTDTNTLGDLSYHATGTGADATDFTDQVSVNLIDDVAAFVDTEVAAIKAKTDNLPSDPADASDIAASFSTVNSTLSTIAGYIDTEVAAIKAKTDQLVFTSAGYIDANTIQWLGTTVSTPTVAGVPNVNVKTWNDLATVALPLIPTVAGRTLDVSTTGEAGVDWANVGSQTTTVGLTNTTISTSQTVLLSSGTGAGQLDFTSGVVKANTIQWLGTAVSTPTVAGIPNINVKTWNDLTTVALPLVPTVAGRTLDVSAAGEAGVDWANVGGQGTTVGLTGTTISTSQVVDSILSPVSVGTNFDKTGYDLSATGLDIIPVSDFAGPASTFPRMVVQLWRRFFRKSTLTAAFLKTYRDDDSTTMTSQAVTDDTVTQTQGTAT